MSHLSTITLLSRPSKLTGYLYAMQSGAGIILDADCSVQISDIAANYRLNDVHQSGLTNAGAEFFNPFEHFGVFQAVPKEFMDLNIHTSLKLGKINSDLYYITDWNSVPIRQGVTASEKTCVQESDNVLDLNHIVQGAAPVSVANSTLAPFSTGPTIFFEEAFPLLFVPPDLDKNVGQLFRTILFKELNSQSFITTAFYYIHNDKQGDSGKCSNKTETPSYTIYLMSILKCMKDFSFRNNYGSYGENLQKLWNCFSTEFPQLGNFDDMNATFSAWTTDLSRLRFYKQNNKQPNKTYMFQIKYRIPRQMQEFRNISKEIKKAVLSDVVSLCDLKEDSTQRALQTMSNPIIDDILLIIVINYKNVFASISYNEYIHRQYFKYIIYCVPSIGEFEEFTRASGFSYLTFIEGLAVGWHYYYECVAAAMKLSLPVKGYLQIGDDVLLNTWNVVAMPRHDMMLSSRQRYVELNQNKLDFTWVHWNTKNGQSAVQNVIAELQKASTLRFGTDLAEYPRANITSFATKFLGNLEGNIGPNMAVFGAGDIFYVPQKLVNEYITATEIFRRKLCMVELALRIIYYGLKPPEKRREILPGHDLWGYDRNKPWLFFKADTSVFLHPFKWLSDTQREEGKIFACQQYLPLLGGNYK